MGKYLFRHFATFPFKRKSFDGQMDRYAKVCVVSVDNPQKVLDIIPIYGRDGNAGMGDIIKLIYDIELGKQLDDESQRLLAGISKPVEGKFEEVNSLHGPLFHQFTPDEAKYGLCPTFSVWKPERDANGKVKLFNSFKVFTLIVNDPDLKISHYAAGWFPNQMYYKYYGYRYKSLSELTEPIQL